MKICAIISEFNPFHNGHKYLIDEIKKQGFTHIISIMSGNLVQRGEPAILSKESRTKMALLNGVDLVIEIPATKVLNSAEKYAEAAIKIAKSLGCVDSLAFGSECGKIEILKRLTKILENKNFEKILKKYISLGNSYPKAKSLALKEFSNDDELVSALESPNNILGIEYLKAIKKLKVKIKPITINRNGKFLSSSEIRNLILNKSATYKNYMPTTSAKLIEKEIEIGFAPSTLENAERAILYSLKNFSKKDFLKISYVSEGLENRILSSLPNVKSIDDLLKNIKTKRYTMARIKRILLLVFLGITKSKQKRKMPYIKILGVSTEGLKILKKAKITATIPLVSKFKEIKKLGNKALDFFETECKISEMCCMFAKDMAPFKNQKAFQIIKGEEIDI